MDFYIDKSFSIDFGNTLNDAKALLLGIPFDSTPTAIPGARLAPLRIREAFFQKETEDLNLCDLGNVVCVHSNVAETGKRVEYTLQKILEKTKSPIFALGGEHLITYWIVRILQPEVLLVFDAHFDMKDEVNGERYTHCTFLRRILEETKAQIVVVGARALDSSEKLFVEQNKNRIVVVSVENPQKKSMKFAKIKRRIFQLMLMFLSQYLRQEQERPRAMVCGRASFLILLENWILIWLAAMLLK